MLSRIQELLALAEEKTAEVRQREHVARCRKEFGAIRKDAHEIARTICAARAENTATLAELATEGKRLGAWAAEIRDAKAEMEKKQPKLRLDDPMVKEEWDAAVAILKHEANLYASETDAREARKAKAQEILDQAYLDMRMGRAEIIERVEDLRPWLHSEEEHNRRLAIKQAKIDEIEAKEAADKAAIKLAQESLQEDLEWLQFGEQVVTYIAAIAENLGKVLPHLITESKANENKEAFVARMKAAKEAKRAKKEAEEAEFQKLVEEEAAAKLAEENKAKAAFFLTQAEAADNLEDARMYILAARELDASVNSMVLVNQAAARLAATTIVETKQANKAVEVCHVQHVKLSAKERRELARIGVRGKDWSKVPVEEM